MGHQPPSPSHTPVPHWLPADAQSPAAPVTPRAVKPHSRAWRAAEAHRHWWRSPSWRLAGCVDASRATAPCVLASLYHAC